MIAYSLKCELKDCKQQDDSSKKKTSSQTVFKTQWSLKKNFQPQSTRKKIWLNPGEFSHPKLVTLVVQKCSFKKPEIIPSDISIFPFKPSIKVFLISQDPNRTRRRNGGRIRITSVLRHLKVTLVFFPLR
jgi:hypothetical protein